MKSQEARNPKTTKLSYERPRLRVIDLTIEETMAVGCKLASPGGTGGFGADPCSANACVNPGS